MNTVAGNSPAGLWYVKRGDEVHGPFRWTVIRRNIGLGRIRDGDCISQDQRQWLPLPRRPMPPPDGVVRSTASQDERRTQRRDEGEPGAPAPEQRRGGGERRAQESTEVLQRRARSERVWAGLRAPASAVRTPLLVVVLLLTAIVGLALTLSTPDTSSIPDCAVAAAPAGNWDFCAKVGVHLENAQLSELSARNARLTAAQFAGADLSRADLAYADLTAADLTLADLRGARLVGSNLRNAALNHALLAHADLRFADLTAASLAGADLTGANLGNAIWVDGRICARESIGACVLP